MKINCLVVDDSSVQRSIIIKMVNNHARLNIVDDFSNAIEAKNCLDREKIDLIFLDIEMPVINGFDFLDHLKVKPMIIFITSKADYAMKAFDYAPTDYLHKPVTPERFDIAINRAIELFERKTSTSKEVDEGDYIYIKSNLKKIKIYTSKIKWIEAFGDYVKIVTEDSNNLVLSTMKLFVNDLSSQKFMRVHKSYIVNIDKIDRFNSKFAEIGSTKIPLRRNIKEELAKALKIE